MTVRPTALKGLATALLLMALVMPVHGATLTVPTGSDPQVNGDRFQTSLNDAQCGDTVVVAAGATYSPRPLYSFSLPNKTCPVGRFVTIQSSATASLPSGRVGYAHISSMATLATNSSAPVISYVRGAGWYRWIGILFTNTAALAASNGFNPMIVDTAEGGYYGAGLWPHDIVYDRVVIRPYEESLSPVPNEVRSAAFGIRLDGANMTLTNSHVAGFCCKHSNAPTIVTQSTAIVIVNGPGPYTITNNFVEAYGWNILTGGGAGQPLKTATLSNATFTSATLSNVTGLKVGDAIRFKFATGFPSSTGCGGGNMVYGSAIVDSISGNAITFHWFGPAGAQPTRAPDAPGEAAWNGVNPSNFTIKGNRFHKRAEWAANSGQCKAFWEMKSGSNVLFEGNILTGPIDAQGKAACSISTALAMNQDGSNPWAATNDNTFRSNLMLGVGDVFSLQPYGVYCPTLPGWGITFTNNLLGFVSGTRSSFWINTLGGKDWLIAHNTVRGNSNSIFKPNCDAANTSCATWNITFRDNIVNSGGYWIQTLGSSPTQYPNMLQDHNVIINDTPNSPPTYASSNFVVGSAGAVGFVDVSSADSGGDYHGFALASTSPFKGRASDGTDPGVNFGALDAALTATPGSVLPAPSNLTVR